MEHLTKPIMAKLFEIKLAVEQMNAGIEMDRGTYNPSKIWNDMMSLEEGVSFTTFIISFKG